MPAPPACAGQPMLWRTVDKMMIVAAHKPELLPPGMPSIEDMKKEIGACKEALEGRGAKVYITISMYIDVYMCTYTHLSIYIYIERERDLHIRMYIVQYCMHVYVYVYVYIYIYIYTHIHMYIYIYIVIHVYVYSYICIYTCVYIYIYMYRSFWATGTSSRPTWS